MSFKLIGKNFTPPDIHAKVTGRAKYAEDFRVEGMVFCRLLSSPVPHARITNINTSVALAMDGVLGVLLPSEATPVRGTGDPMLTDHPKFVGQPILAVAAISETIAQDAIEKITFDIETLPFTVDPLVSLYPGGPNARPEGNMANPGIDIAEHKWDARDFSDAGNDRLPTGKPVREWTHGDIEAEFAKSKLILDETFVTQGLAHHSMEPRSALSYWDGDKCVLHASSQSQSFPVPSVAAYIGIAPERLVFIAEFCGGGFGSKGSGYPYLAIPALMSKKINRPVMMRISRAEEAQIGSSRHGFQGRARLGFGSNGKLLAADLYIVQENGPTNGFNDWLSAGDALSLVYTPVAMRFRGVPVLTNTPHRGPQRGPGQNQLAMAIEPLIDKAARELDIDPVAIRKINAPNSSSTYGDSDSQVTSAYLSDALQKGADLFNWNERKLRSGERNGTKVRGIGVGTAYHSAGSNGFDGLLRIDSNGILHIHTGVGNLGTYSHTSTSRVAAEVLGYDWSNCVVERGDSRKALPWNLGQFGSNTSFTMTRTNYASAMDATNKIKEIAAIHFGGTVDDYLLFEENVKHVSNDSLSLTFAEIASLAISLGGKFSGEEYPEELNEMTKRSVSQLSGTGLIGVAKDKLERNGSVAALAAGFIEIELDTETGDWEIIDYLGVADCGTVIHPLGLAHQIKGAAIMGIGLATSERHIYDPQNGLPANLGFCQSKLPTYLDIPKSMQWSAVGLEDPANPIGAKGIGEPIQGCASAALLCAISDAIGGHTFNRTPVVKDMIINYMSGNPQSHRPLQVNTA
jgi:xanthine dehydrogenase molybdenum-binding subunit